MSMCLVYSSCLVRKLPLICSYARHLFHTSASPLLIHNHIFVGVKNHFNFSKLLQTAVSASQKRTFISVNLSVAGRSFETFLYLGKFIPLDFHRQLCLSVCCAPRFTANFNYCRNMSGNNSKGTNLSGVELDWEWNVDKIAKVTEEIMVKSKAVHDKVGTLKYDEINYDTVIKPLAMDAAEYEVQRNNIEFIKQVYSNKLLRDASVEADKKLSKFDVEMSMRQDVFDSIVTFSEKNQSTLTGETKRLVERLIKLGRKNGLHLPKETQDKIMKIKKRISELAIEFNKNVIEENSVVEFSTEDLIGLPESFISSLEKTDDGKYKVTLKYPHYFPIMKKAHNPETRKKLAYIFHSRCIKENAPILEEVIKLRHEQANLLGYKTHASCVLDMRMAKTPETVQKFYAELLPKLKMIYEKEMKYYLEYKKEMCEKHNFEFDGKINMYDMRYCMNLLEEKDFAIDEDKLREYFSVEIVTEGLLSIYQDLLGLTFAKIENPSVWHPDVTMYSVTDTDSNKLLGYFYLDLFPRDGKYTHAACFGLQQGCDNANGQRRISVAAMVANIVKPTADKPSLLSHEEVQTYFHEFGHVMHQICTETKYIHFSGTNTERDFIEAPSQMLENWVWEEEPLRLMSRHYQDGTPIPDDMIHNLKKSRKANAGIFNLRQMLIGQFDQFIHTQPQVDTKKVFDDLSLELLNIPCIPNTNFSATFSHIVNGYDAQYYGYLWSEVFSVDMFASRFSREGIMNASVGRDYRKYILAPGGSIDADQMLRNFLGRDPSKEAFLISKGLEV
uniref:Peptidase M3A/M3B catalytic domain-containing protein n=2 Tax=Octopus bimaculoides TaxID=37653 RepID=A0A0L8FHT3_OCTBM